MGDNLTVIIITHNRLDYTKRTLESLVRTVPNSKFLIIDNNSDEETKKYLVTFIAQYDVNKGRMIICGENKGWGAAVNTGLMYTKDEIHRTNPPFPMTEYILISNNDVEYHDGWYDKAIELYNKYPQIGLLAVWKHIAHGITEDKGDLIIKDQMPAVGWLFKKENLEKFGPFPEHGPCETKGGNGEDVGYCIKIGHQGMWVAAPKIDIANHIDGY